MKAIDPDVRVLVATGFGQTGVVEDMLTEGAVGALHNPFNIHDLSHEVARASPVKAR